MGVQVKLNGGRAWYVAGMLTFAYALSYIDRQMLNLLVDPMRQSLALSDTQFSLLQGVAFVAAYLVAAPIFGRLTDIANRRNILIFGVCCWSIFTVLCGHANSFWELFAFRAGVGVTEACVYPVAWSMIGDYFTERHAPRAFSLFTIGSQLGSGASLVAGGLVISFASGLRSVTPSLAGLETWQMAFVVVGLPGLLFALLALTIKEPVRRRSGLNEVAEGQMSIAEVRAILWNRRSFYARIYLGTGALAMVQLGIGAWFPAYMIRAHGLAASRVGLLWGAIAVVTGTVATLVGPFVARWLEKRGYADAPFRTAAYAMIGMLICCLSLPLVGADGAFVSAAGAVFFCGLPLGPLASAIQFTTPSRARGAVAGLYSFSAQLIGFGVSPTAIALLTDKVFHDPKAVGHALQIVTSGASILAILVYFTILKVYRRMRNVAGAVEPSMPAESRTVVG